MHDQLRVLAVEDGQPLSDRAERTVRELFEHPLIDVTWSRFEPPTVVAAGRIVATLAGTSGSSVARTAELSASEIWIEPGRVLDEHRSATGVESYFVLDGELEIVLDGRSSLVAPGSWISLLPGALHVIRNPAPSRARVLTIRAPGRSMVPSLCRDGPPETPPGWGPSTPE